jgi:hypothetical protein
MVPDSTFSRRGLAAWTEIVHAEPILQHFADGALLVTPEIGTMLALNASGAGVYEGLSRGESPGEIAAGLAARFGISRDQAETDVAAFLATEPVAGPGTSLLIEDSPFRFAKLDERFVVTREDRPCLDISLDGRIVTVAPGLSLDDARDAAFWVTAKLAVLQGTPVLHASAVRTIGPGALAFAGRSGAGKTTLAHAFAATGAELLCEDSLALDVDRHDGSLMVVPFEQPMRQWTNAILAEVEPGRPLSAILPPLDERSAVRLDRILILDRGRRSGDVLSARTLEPSAAVAGLLVNLFWASLDRAACQRALHWAIHTATLVSVEELTSPDGVRRLPSAATVFAGAYEMRKTASY